MKNTAKMNIYQIVTSRIMDELEKGRIPWHKEWNAQAISYSTRKGYKGINALLVNRPGEYLTFNQITQLQGTLKKGSKGYPIVFYKLFEIEDELTKEVKKVPLPCKYYTVFNLEDTEGIPSKLKPMEAIINPDENAENIIEGYATRTNLTIVHEAQDRAFYRPSTDTVTMPERSQFNSRGGYYSTLFHEITHSTGHSKRLKRPGILSYAGFGSTSYSKEELVAEMGAAMLYSYTGLGAQPEIENSAAYIKSWLKALQNDPRMVLAAANQAQKAADLVLDIHEATEDIE